MAIHTHTHTQIGTQTWEKTKDLNTRNVVHTAIITTNIATTAPPEETVPVRNEVTPPKTPTTGHLLLEVVTMVRLAFKLLIFFFENELTIS